MIIIKIGGVVATDPTVLETLLKDIAALPRTRPVVLVHGGGKEVTAVSDRFGLKAEFRAGIRVTSPTEMDVVDMVLAGKVNAALVRAAQALGLNAVGLGGQDGRLFVAEPLVFDGQPSRTGRVTQADAGLLRLLTGSGFFPVVNSTSMSPDGLGLNINADEAAQELAIAAKAEFLVYVSDIAGVLKAGAVIPRLDKNGLEAEIAAGVIAGGMIPKVRNAQQAVASGVGKVIIGGFQGPGDLDKLLSGSSGTTIL